MSLTDLVQYVKDLKHTVDNFETGLSRKDVVKGYFVENELGITQNLVYNNLLDAGFKRTALQIVFPGQTAGLIRKIDPPIEGMDEIHVRFYDDGMISAELEYGRFSLGHYQKSREDGTAELTKIINREISNLSEEEKKSIQPQVSHRDYPAIDSNKVRLPSLPSILALALVSIQYPASIAGSLYYLNQGDIYAALEPGFISLLETPIFLAVILSPQVLYNFIFPDESST